MFDVTSKLTVPEEDEAFWFAGDTVRVGDVPAWVTVTTWLFTPDPETVIVAVLVPGPVLVW